MAKVALITGITGQDGAYLAEFLLNKGYEVHGIKRRSSLFNTDRIDHIYQDIHAENVRFHLHYGDLTDSTNLIRIMQIVKPDEVYNLAAMSHVHVSFETPEYTANADGIGTLRLLEAIRILGMENKTKIYQASTSELYGLVQAVPQNENTPFYPRSPYACAKLYAYWITINYREAYNIFASNGIYGLVQAVPQNENTPFYPRSPYACAKLYAYWITINYREAYNIFASNGILFNHESPIRGETFVTRKITRGVSKIALGLQDKLYLGNLSAKRDWGHAKDYVEAMYLIETFVTRKITRGVSKIALGLQDKLYLGNLSAKRDWGHAKDYVEAMYLILQQEIAQDFVIATGVTTEVRDFVRLSFKEVGIDIEFKGSGVDEVGIVAKCNGDYKLPIGKEVVAVDSRYFRPTEVDLLLGDPSKAQKLLGWSPKYDLSMLVADMMQSDLKLMQKDKYLKDGGYTIMRYFE